MTLYHLNENIKVLWGSRDLSINRRKAFDKLVLDFLGDLSKDIRSNPKCQSFPDVLSFGFFCRRANLERLSLNYKHIEKNFGRGMVLHIAPSNVPINFAFSFAFGLLSGNSNIVRLSSKKYLQIDLVIEHLRTLTKSSKYAEFFESNSFIQYDHNDMISNELSAKSDARLLWGGDNTVEFFKRMPTKPRCIDLAFANRFSFCVISSSQLETLDVLEMESLAKKFYNDTYLMDQNACSSPQIVFWQGENNLIQKRRFWDAIQKMAVANYELAEATSVEKLTLLYSNCIQNEFIKSVHCVENIIYRIELSSIPDFLNTIQGRYGMFFEYDLVSYSEIVKALNHKIQTVTYFGINKFELRDLVERHSIEGIDRIVPIGQALDIGLVWDGYDVIQFLTRSIDLR